LDVLFTDTEDFEMEVLNGVNWVEGRPKVVVAELASLTSNRSVEITEFLSERGYSLALEASLNGFYADGSRRDWD
jgi:hypothetical protein